MQPFKMSPETVAQLRRSSALREIDVLLDAIVEEDFRTDRLLPKIRATSTHHLPALWFVIADQFLVTPKQAANFIETQGAEKSHPEIYAPHRTGLFFPLADETALYAWVGAYTAADHMDWDRVWCNENLDFLRLSVEDADRIMAAARRTYGAPPDDTQHPGSDAVPPYLDPAHPRYAPKLAAAVSAWLAVGDPPASKTPKQALTAWLSEQGSRYGLRGGDGKPIKEAVTMCATVANWRPSGGAPKTPGA